MPRIPASNDWTSENALKRYAYILPPEHYGSKDGGGLFLAFVDGKEMTITAECLYEFLTSHADRTFITCDALAFHNTCMDAFAGSRKKQAATWRLSREYRLWDVALLERRIRYAKTGRPSNLAGFDELRQSYAPETVNLWDVLRMIFVKQIDYAVAELPLLITYWGMGATVDGVRQDGHGLPRSLTTDEFCEYFYAGLYRRYKEEYERLTTDREREIILIPRKSSRVEGVAESAASPVPLPNDTDQQVTIRSGANKDIVPKPLPACLVSWCGWPKPQRVELPPEKYSDDMVKAFRRRDIILQSRTGPLGVGLDCQAAIVASHLKNRFPTRISG